MIKNKVVIIGLGVIGLNLLLEINKVKKFKTYGFDISLKRIQEINIKYPKLKINNNSKTIKNAEFIIIAIKTQGQIKSICSILLKQLEKGQKIIIESTLRVGTCENVIKKILEKSGLKAGIDFDIAHCPERLNPGDKKWTIKNIPRNLASSSRKANKEIKAFYKNFIDAEIHELSSLKVCEASKLIENSFRDLNIAFVNELSKIFDDANINLKETILASANKPFGFIPHFAGCGVGGRCIPEIPKFHPEKNIVPKILTTARKINNSMPKYTIKIMLKALKEIKKDIKDIKIGILGLSYKENFADKRGSVSLKIISELKELNANFQTFDPYLLKDSSVNSLNHLLNFSDILLITTAHDEFKKIKVNDLEKQKIKIIIDGRNCLDQKKFINTNIIYKGIGNSN